MRYLELRMATFIRRTHNPLLKGNRRRVAPGFITLLLGATTFLRAGSSQSQSITPKITVDLRPLGYTVPTIERYIRALDFLDNAVAFLDEDTLAVSYFVKNDHPGFSRRDGAPSGHVFFRSAFVDARTGSISAQRTWSNAGYWNAFLPMENGFFIQANDWISLYSPDLHLLIKRRLVYAGDRLPRFAVSPSGLTLYSFQDWQPLSTRSWITQIALLDPATLELKQAQITPMHSDETVSDRQVVYRVNPTQLILESYSPESSSGTVKTPPRDSDLGKLLRDSRCTSMAFVSNSVLAIGGACSHLILLGTHGLFSDGLMADVHFKDRTVEGDFHSSRDGNRLAFILYGRDDRSKQRAFEVDVYDIGERKVVFQSEISPSPRIKIAIALSPKGSQLAVVSDNIVRAWQLPTKH